ncbi:MAG: hypothetical protein ACKERG_04170 [Candidatus Hodgkinia cicadicola]
MYNAGTWAGWLIAAVCLMSISLLISAVNSVVTTGVQVWKLKTDSVPLLAWPLVDFFDTVASNYAGFVECLSLLQQIAALGAAGGRGEGVLRG